MGEGRHEKKGRRKNKGKEERRKYKWKKSEKKILKKNGK